MGFIKGLIKDLTGNNPLLVRVTPRSEGIDVSIFQKNHPIPHRELSSPRLSKRLPSPLLNLIQSSQQPQNIYYILTFPQAKSLCQALQPYLSENLQLDSTALDALQIIDCPDKFAIHWNYYAQRQVLIRSIENADRHLGEGWFQHDQQVWCIEKGLTENMLAWLGLPEIMPRLIFPFVSTFMLQSQEMHLPFDCDLTILNDLTITLKIKNMLRDSMVARLDASHPQLLNSLQALEGDEHNMISGTTLISNIRPVMQPLLRQLVHTSRTIQGNDLLTFIQDEVRPNAKFLNIDMQMIDDAYPIVDASTLDIVWELEHRLKDGVGQYAAVPYLNWNGEHIPFEVVLKHIKNDVRFYQSKQGWIEFTTSFLKSSPVQKGEATFWLETQDLLGTWTQRLQHTHLSPPEIKVPSTANEQEHAEKFLDAMRQHGLPAAVCGLQKDIIDIIRNICIHLRTDKANASILWIVSTRKKDDVFTSLRHSGLSGKGVIVASPDELSRKWLKTKWIMLVLQDVDILTSNQAQIHFYSQLNRRWTLGTFAKNTWLHNNERQMHVMMAFRLRQEDAQSFHTKCIRVYSDQKDGLLSRLGSPFKKVFLSGDNPSSGIPIPPRPQSSVQMPSSMPQPRQEQNQMSFGISFAESSTGDSFVKQAKRYATRTEAHSKPVPFMQYWPTYAAMTPSQQRWYFYWRTQVRAGNVLATDLSYMFVHIYEAINLIGFKSASEGFQYLVSFWKNYRTLQPKLDHYLIDWIADFIVVNKLPQTPLGWYWDVLQVGVFSGDIDLSIEAWVISGADVKQLPADLLYKWAAYSPAKNKFYQQYREEYHLDENFKKALQAVNQYLKEATGKSLFETYSPVQTRTIQRPIFAGALHDYQQKAVMIVKIRPWASHTTLTNYLKQILRQTENILRAQANFRSKLRGIELPLNWIEVIEQALAPEPVHREIEIDAHRVSELEQESEEIRERLIQNPDDDVPQMAHHQTPVEATSKSPSTIQVYRASPTHLREVALIMGEEDSPIAKILRTFYENSWQVSPSELQRAVEGDRFINVLLDEINTLAFAHIGQALLFEENGDWVVEEDYRDEISYLLEHPNFAEKQAEPSSNNSELTDEWARFVKELQSHHWETLAALLSKTDVTVRIDAIARRIYSTTHQLIDDINGFALDSIGDIIIDTSGETPEIEEEDFEMVADLLTWASQKELLS